MFRKGFQFGVGVLAALAIAILAVAAIHIAAVVGIFAYKSRHNQESMPAPPTRLEAPAFTR